MNISVLHKQWLCNDEYCLCQRSATHADETKKICSVQCMAGAILICPEHLICEMLIF
jgi:hypothetical protein